VLPRLCSWILGTYFEGEEGNEKEMRGVVRKGRGKGRYCAVLKIF